MMNSFHSFSGSSLPRLLSQSLLLASFASNAAAQNASNLQECLTGGTLQVTLAQDPTWENATSPWSLRFNPEPAAVVIPQSNEDIAAALECAVQFETKVAALNGGHSYGAYGLGETDGALVINMENFNTPSYDEATELLTYGGGSRVGPIATWLWNNHGRHFPHVRANWVGLAGSSIGAGFGTTSRFLGTPMDFLDSVEYMLYNGTIVKASRTENADLFWVAQGAGSSYGILLSLTTRTWKPEFNTVTNFTLSLGNVDIDTGVEALLAVQEYGLNEAPDTFAIRWALAEPWSGSGYFYGNPDEFDAVIAPLIERLPNTTTLTKSTADFWSMENFASPALNGTADTFPPRSMYLQALVLRSDQPFTFESAKALYEHTTFAFNRTDMTKFGFLDLWGGVSRDIKDTDTSYEHADSLWLVRWEGRLANGLSEWPADGIEYMQNGFRPFVEQLQTEGVPLRGFVNYRDTELTEEQWSQRLFGANYERMKQIKTDIDPLGIFTTNSQSIPSS
ncbi:glucooligosaccharide oxidase-like protein [Corynespora cassiicola Philippines]|uniref:Glucooligosaccharide oxidase-like protein n=1 Tax=Corynespora cassiicola Philippines TaxID=1448308 RepID=A0A2T2PAK0_CORCC|nr:glucooligosaccharide oxidase-like protein [Corynespora cassiicola Philippines]